MAALPHAKRVVQLLQLSAIRGTPAPLTRFRMGRVGGRSVVISKDPGGIKTIICNQIGFNASIVRLFVRWDSAVSEFGRCIAAYQVHRLRASSGG
jgi:hypothetical protein